ncbi:TBC1 domain family member 31 isoform X2 [Athalia rosae]|uniref:TBC1 domain family member 31 isoform X2 n=1 Tax=Athalia rosae TaxID=37344 RepID=UPI002033ABA7|nr:TBC1 domain family member 31 isoform X2 [Athalia rosae]
MEAKKWISLKKTSLGYTLDTSVDEMISTSHSCRNVKYPLTHVAFDCSGERLVTADSKGLLILIELGQSMRYCRLGKVQSCTIVAFNPADSMEILVGANNGDIQIVKLNGKAKDYCSLIGHKFAVRHISHYKSYTLTSSLKEVIIWDLSSSSKIHQLRLAAAAIGVLKGGFSSQGLVAVLYRDSTLQVWKLKKLEEDIKIDAKALGLRDAKDYEFTRDGRTIILSGISNIILILNTLNWNSVKRLVLPDSLANIKELSVLPQPLDGGANKIAAILSSNHRLYFLDLDTSCLVPLSCGTFLTRVQQMRISPSGVHVVYIDILGCLRLELADTLLVLKPQSKVKVKMTCQPRVHDVNDHLSCVRQDIKQELNLERLMLILNKFGKYPGKYRTLIWATILELPRNRPAYAALSNKIACHELTGRILNDYPLENRSKATFLATIFNCLVHWCPMLRQCTFLPRLIFPFLIVMQGNHILAFEIIIFILLNYCQQWFEYHPLPPLSVLAMLENILSEHDPQLLDFFCKKRVTTTEYVWPLLESMMSEVLCGDEWLILWDHLFTFAHPPLLLMCSLAYSICSRQIIMSRLQSIEDFRCFYHAQGHVQVEDLLKVAYRLDQNTPHHLHPTKYFSFSQMFPQ